MDTRNRRRARAGAAISRPDSRARHEQFSDLVGRIYDCALAPAQWEAAVREICRQFAYDLGMMSVLRFLTGMTMMKVAVGVTPELAARSAEYQDDVIEAWGGPERVMAYPLDEPVIASRVVGPAALAKNRYLREWAHPQGVRDSIAIAIARTPTMLGNIAFSRREPAKALGDGEIEQLRLIAPHIRRAVTISDLFDMKAIEAGTLGSLLDGFTFGIVLVDAELGIVHANQAAEATLGGGSQSLRSVRGRLVLPKPALQDVLDHAVRKAADDAGGLGGTGIGIPVMANDDPMVIHVLPLRLGKMGRELGSRAVAALFITTATDSANVPFDALAAVHGLTPAETRIFELIVEGRTGEEIAKALGVAQNTVKFHIRNLFAKTGCHRGADLLRLAASFARPT